MALSPVLRDPASALPHASSFDEVGARDAARAASGLQERLASIQSVFDSAPVGLGALGLDFRYVIVNECLAKLYGKMPDDFVGRTVVEVLPGPAEQIMTHFREALRAGGAVEREITLTRPGSTSNERAIYLRTAKPVLDSTGAVVGVAVALLDITERKRAEIALRESEENLRYTVELTPHIPWTAAPSGELTFMSARWMEITGMRADSETLKRWIFGVHVDDRVRTLERWKRSIERGVAFDCDCRIRCVGGVWRWHRSRAYPRRGRDGKVLQWYGTIEDIHDRKLAEAALADRTVRLENVTEALDKLAHEDHLTALANRRTFDEMLLKEIERARRARVPLALALLDVDHFKKFNDEFGHPAGDEVLRRVSRTIDGVLRRPSDLAARFGGEEFALVMPNTAQDGALLIARRANEAVREIDASLIAEGCAGVRISGGVAMLELTLDKPGAQLAAELIARADGALYEAKKTGRDRVVLHAAI